METKHTPGPWFATRAERYFYIFSEKQPNAAIPDFFAEIRAFEKDIEKSEANARLIAAAPDLLEKCEIALSYIEAVCFNTPNPKKRKNYADCAGQLRAAIAKATGE